MRILSKINSINLTSLFTVALLLGSASLGAVVLVIPAVPAHAVTPNTFQQCDIFSATVNGQIDWYRPNVCPGIPSTVTFQATLCAGTPSPIISGTCTPVYPGNAMTGMALDYAECALGAGNPCLYATGFNSNSVYVFDNTGAYLGTCGAPGAFSTDVESADVVPGFSGGPSIFFGQADGTTNIYQFPLPCNSSSTLTHAYTVCTGELLCPSTGGNYRGSDWIDMSANLCDIFYTSEGTLINDFNVCTSTQAPTFATGLTGFSAYAHKFLPDGSVIVADTSQVVHVSNTGTTINTCDSASPGITGNLISPTGVAFSMDILPGAAAYAMGSQLTNQIDYMTIAHCDAGQTTPDFSFVDACPNTPGFCDVQGVAIYGEPTPSQESPTPGTMTGGGNFNVPFVLTHGFEVNCVANQGHSNLEIQWASGSNTYDFKMTGLLTAVCFQNPTLGSSSPPTAHFNTWEGTGTGKLNGVGGYTFFASFTDQGQPAAGKDISTIIVWDPSHTVVLSITAVLKDGVQQAHDH